RHRADNLLTQGWATQKRHDSAIATETRARSSVAQAQAGLAARRQRLVVLDAEAVRLAAAIKQAEAQVRLARISMSDVAVHAPVAGVIGNRHIEVGHYARPGAPLLSIVSDEVWVVANFKETQLELMKPGQLATVWVDAFGKRKLTGRIDSLAPASGAEFSLLPPDNATGNFVRVPQRIPVKIRISDRDQEFEGLRPGLSAEVQVEIRGSEASSEFSLIDQIWTYFFKGDDIQQAKMQ
ncbi:MAG: HlyD family secretion protein, partial [Sneathiellales bacterium]|nr:HlyD family secretion protein [Sneathiellales bacterium]